MMKSKSVFDRLAGDGLHSKHRCVDRAARARDPKPMDAPSLQAARDAAMRYSVEHFRRESLPEVDL
ncbi:hypothetical protein [Rhizobium lentis]|uniref:hypothetical protein n=1 Tax=Rhizobium lentis TaxID=1138194 RepID=UPI001C830DBC|nr:hypothetical protein [Rhizobium lentis]MBX5014952.1 hypothetical protein [Rhizobium lentis]